MTVTADQITITDDDTRGILSKSSVTVTEASGTGRTAEYKVKLASQPTGATVGSSRRTLAEFYHDQLEHRSDGDGDRGG